MIVVLFMCGGNVLLWFDGKVVVLIVLGWVCM